jgi:hypothetical protein
MYSLLTNKCASLGALPYSHSEMQEERARGVSCLVFFFALFIFSFFLFFLGIGTISKGYQYPDLALDGLWIGS